MSQATTWGVPLVSPATPTVMAQRMQDSLDALLSAQKGNTRPSYATAGMMWIDDTTNPWNLYMHDGSADRLIATYNTSTNIWMPANVQTSLSDTTVDRLMKVGAGGWLGAAIAAADFNDTDLPTTVYKITNTVTNRPFDWGLLFQNRDDANAITQTALNVITGEMHTRCKATGSFTPWVQVQTDALANKYIDGSFNMATSTGSFNITGVGFKPRAVYAISQHNDGESTGFGIVGATNCSCLATFGGSWYLLESLMYAEPVENHSQEFYVSSFNADGLTIVNTKAGSPTGTLEYALMCMR